MTVQQLQIDAGQVHLDDRFAGQRVGLASRRGPQLIVSLLAVLKSGAAYVPLAMAEAGTTIKVAQRGKIYTATVTAMPLPASWR